MKTQTSLITSTQNDVSLAQNAVLVTTKELAETLDVSIDTVARAANKVIAPSAVLRRVINGGNSKVFTEKQATLIKQEIQKHHNLASRQIDSVSTEFEENQIVANAVAILQRRNIELRQRMEIAENTLNRIADGKGCYSMNQTAKALKLPFGNIKLYERLRCEGILNADNSPRQEQINAGHFKVVVKHINDKIGNKPVTLTTSKGLVYLARKFNTTIDESVQADAE